MAEFRAGIPDASRPGRRRPTGRARGNTLRELPPRRGLLRILVFSLCSLPAAPSGAMPVAALPAGAAFTLAAADPADAGLSPAEQDQGGLDSILDLSVPPSVSGAPAPPGNGSVHPPLPSPAVHPATGGAPDYGVGTGERRSARTLAGILRSIVNIRPATGDGALAAVDVFAGGDRETGRAAPASSPDTLSIRELALALIQNLIHPWEDARGDEHFSILGLGDFSVYVTRYGDLVSLSEHVTGLNVTPLVPPENNSAAPAEPHEAAVQITIQAFIHFLLSKILSSPIFYIAVAGIVLWGTINAVLRLQAARERRRLAASARTTAVLLRRHRHHRRRPAQESARRVSASGR